MFENENNVNLEEKKAEEKKLLDAYEAEKEKAKEEKREATKRGVRDKLVIGSLLVVIIILIILLLRGCGGNEGGAKATPIPNGDNPAVTATPTPEAGPVEGSGELNDIEEYDPEKIKEQLNANQNSCSINASNYVEFADKNAYGELKLRNMNDFYVQVSILPYENETIDISKAYWTSILIGPGEEMNKIKLDKNLGNLKEGVQTCLLYYDCFDKNEDGGYKRLGNCGLKISVNVLSAD